MLFRVGKLVATPGALDAFTQSGDNPAVILARYVTGDWGEMCDEDKKTNDHAVSAEDPGRLMACYKLSDGTRVWLITEWDRSVTTFLLPEEY